jgi:DNA-binding helix-hairpin-helix protein with protein kinase domain
MRLVDSTGRAIPLGHLIGKGGEGNVYEVDGEPTLLAKVYHHTPLTEDQFCKLDLMVARRTSQLSHVAAWPEEILRRPSGNEPCGLLMPKLDKSRQLHELYGTTNRRLHFPDVRWHHLLLAARNLAAAFHTLHEQGIVVGDVNQGNLMVNTKYNIHFIDCDSFQISDGDKIYYCPVGTPHFTPPELQKQKLSDVARTIDHDGFGLAVLIFHLVFVGRHPFAGRFRGEGDLLIEEAIAEQRFAFSRDKEATMVEPPPYSLQLEDLPPALADLFEIAFRTGGVNGIPRPTPEQWVEQLDALMSHRAACELDDLHIYYSDLKACPWCRIEDDGGPAFFVKDGGSSFVSDGRLELLDRKINALRPIAFPDLPPSQVTPPTSVALKETDEKATLEAPDIAAMLLVVAALLCLGGIASSLALAFGCLLALASGAYLLLSPAGKARRQKLIDFDTNLQKLRRHMLQMGRTTSDRYKKRKRQFDANLRELRATVKRYCSEGDQLKDVLRAQKGKHKNTFLRGHLLRDHVADIQGLAPGMIPMLESYGVETALDVHKLGVYGVPGLSPELALEMLQWRELVEQQFVYKPEHGVTAEDLERTKQAATHRFKLSQARRILIGARHLESLALVGKAAVRRSGREFENIKVKWKQVAREKGAYQLSRTRLERAINSSPAVVASVAIAIPIVGGLISLIFG